MKHALTPDAPVPSDPWQPRQPLWLQLQQRLLERILEEGLGDGEPLPSVRRLAAESGLNPLTVQRALRGLADAGFATGRRGKRMLLADGARVRLIAMARQRIVREEWPRLATAMRRAGLTLADLAALPGRD